MVFPLPLVDHILASIPFPVYVPISTPYAKHFELFDLMISPDFVVMTKYLYKAYDVIANLISVPDGKHSELFDFMISPDLLVIINSLYESYGVILSILSRDIFPLVSLLLNYVYPSPLS